ncbi:MAG: GIY-YIG nuclease family protein [Agriterribacter sp.]
MLCWLTSNVENRLKEHNSRKTKSTKAYVPWELCFFEKLNTRVEARQREVYLKSGIGKEYIKQRWSGSSVG